MGFFVPDEQVEAAKTVKRSTGQRKPKSGLGAKGCDACSMRQAWPRLASPRMPLKGALDGDILILGTNPSIQDDRDRMLWVGPEADKLLRDAIPGRYRDRIAYQSMIRCNSGEHTRQDENIKDAHACSDHLAAEIEGSQIKYVMSVGKLPLRYFAEGEQIDEIYGTFLPIKIGERKLWYYPIFDPWYAYGKMEKYSDGPVMPVFKADIKNFFACVDNGSYAHEPYFAEIDPSAVIIPNSLEEAQALIDQMVGVLGIDIETKSLKPMLLGTSILCAGISDGYLTIAFPIDHPQAETSWGLQLLLDTARKRQWVAHNASFELLWFTYFAELIGQASDFASFDDSMAMGRLYHDRHLLLDLGSLSRIHLGVNIKSLSEVNPRNIMAYHISEVLPYCGIDAQASALIRKRILHKVEGQNYQRFLASVQSTSRMELLGLTVDSEASARLRLQWEAKGIKALKGHEKIYEVRQFMLDKQREFNIASGLDLGEALVKYGRLNLPMTDGGKQYATDDNTLRKAAPDNPLVKAALASREAEKMVSTYIAPLEQAPLIYATRRAHPSYTTMLTATTRLSSNSPNIQNFPKRKHIELREPIIARPGHLLYAFDFGQLEARVIAMATKDRNLCHGIIAGRDIHSDWLNNCLDAYPDYLERLAIETNQTDEKKIRKYGRDIIKTDFVFASFFGSTANSVSLRTKIPREIVDDLHGEFWKEFSGVKAWIKARRAEYDSTGSMRLLTDIVRHTVNWGGNEPINTPIQGTAACIVVDCMNDLASAARDTGDMYIHPRVNIHDDLMFELPDDGELALPYIKGIMETMVEVRYDFQIVPLMVEAKVGPSWASLEEFTTFTGEYVR